MCERGTELPGGDASAARRSGTTIANGITGILSTKTGTAAPTYYERTPSGGLIAERGAGGEFYYVTDGNGSTVALVDTTGTVQATYSYDPAGQTTSVGGPNPAIAGGNPYRYAGGYTDTTTGLIKFGARYYNPTLGRWTQLDSLTSLLDFTNGNRYAYAGDDPINTSDPSGHCIFGHVDGPDSACRGSNVKHDIVYASEYGGGAVLAAAGTVAVCGATAGVGCALAAGAVGGAIGGGIGGGVSSTAEGNSDDQVRSDAIDGTVGGVDKGGLRAARTVYSDTRQAFTNISNPFSG